ncbi:hypothetical protein SAMN04487947_2895 [Halogeometricum rufum]|uniref:Uncharacterized protein n=1 Tax=Halogeometricum rufum TaxID=553469 RepID=A0A1I6I5F2_9EURY|nr:hypothetical protein SAMN04487947_2895 [Halogeometricum rufum]
MQDPPPLEMKSICALCPVRPRRLVNDGSGEWIRETVTESTPFGGWIRTIALPVDDGSVQQSRQLATNTAAGLNGVASRLYAS